jgi:hypothetical protein
MDKLKMTAGEAHFSRASATPGWKSIGAAVIAGFVLKGLVTTTLLLMALWGFSYY